MNKMWGFRLVYKCLVVNRAGYKKIQCHKKEKFQSKVKWYDTLVRHHTHRKMKLFCQLNVI